MTKKKPFTDNTKNLRIDEEISDDMKFVDAIPLEELKMKTSNRETVSYYRKRYIRRRKFPEFLKKQCPFTYCEWALLLIYFHQVQRCNDSK